MNMSPKNGLVKFNRNVEKDIFGYFCLSFLNEDGEISEKKVRHDFSKFGEVVSVRGALGKQKGHVFVRFRKKEAEIKIERASATTSRSSILRD